MMQIHELWQAVLGELEMQIPRPTFEAWLSETRLRQREGHLYVVGVPNGDTREWLEQNLKAVVAGAVARVTGGPAHVRFVMDATARPSSPATRLQPHDTFDTFFFGPENEAAYAAARAVVGRTGTCRFSLYIHGAVGLGKTHLLHAVGNAFRAAGRTIRYTTPQHFTSALIQALRRRAAVEFRQALLAVDVLLLDDVQLFAGRERAQMELLHILPALHRLERQIVIAGDRPVTAISGLNERVRAWVAGGTQVQLHPPALATRVAILRALAGENQTTIPDEVLTFIAQSVDSNVRELEGALNRVLAGAAVSDLAVDLGVARQMLTDESPRQRVVTVGDVITAVARHYGLSVTALCGSGRARTISLPRQVCMYLARTETSASLPEIGAKLGNRDHTTVLYGYEKIAGAIRHNENLRQVTITIRSSLRTKS
jgi:chromosomal replication initiator protein